MKDYCKVNKFDRFLSTTLDISTLLLIYYILDSILFLNLIPLSISFFFVGYLYYLVSYTCIGTTIPKLLLNIKLVNKDLNKASVKSCLYRETIKLAFILSILAILKFIGMLYFIIVLALLIILYILINDKIILWEYLSHTILIKKQLSDKKPKIISLVILLLLSTINISIVVLKFNDTSMVYNIKYPYQPFRIKKYTNYLDNHRQTALDYVFEQFEKNDIVIIGERLHPEYTQWDFIYEVVSDKRFQKVNTIFTEYGQSDKQSIVDTFLTTQFKDQQEKDKACAKILRDCMGVWPIWINRNFYDFLQKVNSFNNTASTNNVRLYFTDVPVDWDNMTPEKWHEEHHGNNQRDRYMADIIIKTFNKLKADNLEQKCLVIMNFSHSFIFRNDDKSIYYDERNSYLSNYTAAHLYKNYPDQTANILLNTVQLKGNGIIPIPYLPINNGKWDAAFEKYNEATFGFDFNDSPFGYDKFDIGGNYFNKFKFKDVFDGYVYYNALNKHYKVEGYPYMVEGYEKDILDRASNVNEKYQRKLKINLEYFKEKISVKSPMPYGFIINIFKISIVIISALIILVFCFISGLKKY